MSVLLLHFGASPSLVGPVQLVFGVFGLIGIWAAGPRFDRRLRGTTLVILVILSAGITGVVAIMLVPLDRRAFPKAAPALAPSLPPVTAA